MNQTASKSNGKAAKLTASRSLLYVELGSVSFKASLVLKDAANRFLLESDLEEKKLKNLLGLEVYRQRTLSDEIVARARGWFEEVCSWALSKAAYPADEVLVVATAAFRDMEIFPALEEAVRRTFATRIQVLDGFIEAQMLVNGYGRPREEGRAKVLFDLGGGSLQIVCLEKASTHFTSLQLGAGRVTAWVMDGHPLEEVKGWIFRELRGKCQTLKALSSGVWLGTGGAVRSFSGLKRDPREPIRDFEIDAEVRRLASLLFETDGGLKPEAMRDDFKGLVEAAPVDLPGHRRRIHVGGIVILDCLCKHFGVRAVKLEKASVRAGALAMLDLLRTAPLEAAAFLAAQG
ncbi:MAG: hypothetical protein HY721_13635 [Planctomycetes bacterium]|nr:hypothetical protein [Planctomycetota bacterium]